MSNQGNGGNYPSTTENSSSGGRGIGPCKLAGPDPKALSGQEVAPLFNTPQE